MPKLQEAYICLSMPTPMRRVLEENKIDLIDALRRKGVEATRISRPEKGPPAPSGLKSPEMWLLASAASVPIVASGVATIISALANRGVILTEKTWKPILDKDNNPMLKDGKPLMAWTKKEKLVEPKRIRDESTVMKFVGFVYENIRGSANIRPSKPERAGKGAKPVAKRRGKSPTTKRK
jgi:hypothetical protein